MLEPKSYASPFSSRLPRPMCLRSSAGRRSIYSSCLKRLSSRRRNYAMQTSLLSSNVTTSYTNSRLTMVFPLSLSNTLETIQFQWEEERLPDVRLWSEKPFTCRMFFRIQNTLVPAINL